MLSGCAGDPPSPRNTGSTDRPSAAARISRAVLSPINTSGTGQLRSDSRRQSSGPTPAGSPTVIAMAVMTAPVPQARLPLVEAVFDVRPVPELAQPVLVRIVALAGPQRLPRGVSRLFHRHVFLAPL